jgi:NADPH:quinone reductase-like Zn-dependent oxidoreductase
MNLTKDHMKAAQINSYGEKDVVSINDVPKPSIKADQILVEVHAASVNPFDLKVREGQTKDYIPLELPATLGGDVSGVVAELGSGVTGLEIGQEVYGMANATGGQGSFAEFTTVIAAQLAPKPRSVDFVSSAALPLTAVSAYQALVDHMRLQPGQKILIHGGAGGIGSIAIQIANNIGAYVATTAIGPDADYVKNLGADEVIDYTKEDFSEKLSDYDAVFDTVGGETNAKSYKVLKKGGVLVSMVAPVDLDLAEGITYVQQSSQATVEKLTKIADMVDSGKIKVNVDKVFQFEEAAEALEYIKTGHPRGKVVIQVK